MGFALHQVSLKAAANLKPVTFFLSVPYNSGSDESVAAAAKIVKVFWKHPITRTQTTIV
jgi:hypothetical protein